MVVLGGGAVSYERGNPDHPPPPLDLHRKQADSVTYLSIQQYESLSTFTTVGLTKQRNQGES